MLQSTSCSLKISCGLLSTYHILHRNDSVMRFEQCSNLWVEQEITLLVCFISTVIVVDFARGSLSMSGIGSVPYSVFKFNQKVVEYHITFMSPPHKYILQADHNWRVSVFISK